MDMNEDSERPFVVLVRGRGDTARQCTERLVARLPLLES